MEMSETFRFSRRSRTFSRAEKNRARSLRDGAWEIGDCDKCSRFGKLFSHLGSVSCHRGRELEKRISKILATKPNQHERIAVATGFFCKLCFASPRRTIRNVRLTRLRRSPLRKIAHGKEDAPSIWTDWACPKSKTGVATLRYSSA